jgi:hypothetical protein
MLHQLLDLVLLANERADGQESRVLLRRISGSNA